MKFRTDFVTNSSDASFIAFNVKNRKLYDFLKSFGIVFKGTKDGEFREGMDIVLPSGKSTTIENGDWMLPDVGDFSSESAWLVAMMLEEIDTRRCGNIDRDELSDYSMELIKILNDAGITHLDPDADELDPEEFQSDLEKALHVYDKAIEYASIEQTSGFEGDGGFIYEEIREGKMTEYYSGSTEELDEEDLDAAWDVICGGGVKEFMQYIEEKECSESEDDDEVEEDWDPGDEDGEDEEDWDPGDEDGESQEYSREDLKVSKQCCVFCDRKFDREKLIKKQSPDGNICMVCQSCCDEYGLSDRTTVTD